MVGALLAHVHIAHPLSGEAQALGPGVADDGVVIDAGDPGGDGIAVDQLPVGLIGDDVDGLAVLRTLAVQQCGQLLKGLGGVDGTGGIVGGVEDDGLGIGVQGVLQGGKIDLEVGDVRRDHHQTTAGALHEGTVLGEEGSHGDELGIFHSQSADDAHQLRSRAAADEQVICPDTGVVTLIQVICHRLPQTQIAGGGGVAVDSQGGHFRDDGGDGLVDPGGGGDRGVAQGIVEDILRTYDGGPLAAIFKQLPDAGTVGTQGVHILVDHLVSPQKERVANACNDHL